MEKVAAPGEMPKPTTGRDFYIATADEIRAGRTSDIYFARTLDVLKKAGRSRAKVVAEVTTGALPNGWPWGIFCGLAEVVHLLTGKDVSVWALPEGSLFPPKTARGIPVPVLTLEGPYEEWALYETPVLGMICRERHRDEGRSDPKAGERKAGPVVRRATHASRYRAAHRTVGHDRRSRRDHDAPRRRAPRRARDRDDAPCARDRDGRTAGSVRGRPQIPRSEDSADRPGRHLLRREDRGADGR